MRSDIGVVRFDYVNDVINKLMCVYESDKSLANRDRSAFLLDSVCVILEMMVALLTQPDFKDNRKIYVVLRLVLLLLFINTVGWLCG